MKEAQALMKTKTRWFWPVFKDSWSAYSSDKVPVLGAARSYYTVFSLDPRELVKTGLTLELNNINDAL